MFREEKRKFISCLVKDLYHKHHFLVFNLIVVIEDVRLLFEEVIKPFRVNSVKNLGHGLIACKYVVC